jgi:hypothetical protein
MALSFAAKKMIECERRQFSSIGVEVIVAMVGQGVNDGVYELVVGKGVVNVRSCALLTRLFTYNEFLHLQ